MRKTTRFGRAVDETVRTLRRESVIGYRETLQNRGVDPNLRLATPQAFGPSDRPAQSLAFFSDFPSTRSLSKAPKTSADARAILLASASFYTTSLSFSLSKQSGVFHQVWLRLPMI